MDQKTGYRTRSIICLPIVNHLDQVVGVAELVNKKGPLEKFTSHDEQVHQLDKTRLKKNVKLCVLLRFSADIYRSLASESKTPASSRGLKRSNYAIRFVQQGCESHLMDFYGLTLLTDALIIGHISYKVILIRKIICKSENANPIEVISENDPW